MSRKVEISIDLEGKGSKTTLCMVATGSECRIDDLAIALQGWLAEYKRGLKPQKKPCGCKDAG